MPDLCIYERNKRGYEGVCDKKIVYASFSGVMNDYCAGECEHRDISSGDSRLSNRWRRMRQS